MARHDDKEILEESARYFEEHALYPSDSKTFLFSASGGARTHRWFNLTWAPGTLTLTGDVGEMTITHYNALAEFEEGIAWAANSDYDYLLGKAGVTPDVLHHERTIDYLLETASERALEARRAQRAERLDCLQGEKAISAMWETEMAWWNLTRDGPPPRLSDMRFSAKDYMDELHSSDPRFLKRTISTETYLFVTSDWIAPEGWEDWYTLYTEIYLEHYHGGEPKEMILTPRGRREIAAAVRRHVRGMRPDAVAELCQELGYSDYYGTYVTCPSALQRITAIQRGCNLILDSLHPRRTWGKTWGDPVV